MSFFDPHHVYDKKKRKSHKGQIIQKKLGTQLIPPMSREELARVGNYLLSNGLVTKDRKYSQTIHKIFVQENAIYPSNGYIVFHFPAIYNQLFKDLFEWRIPATGTQNPKYFEVMVGITRIESTLSTNLTSTAYTYNIQISDRTAVQELTNTHVFRERPIVFTCQDVSFCELYLPSTNSRIVNYTTVNNYSYLASYHSYDINDYRKFALGSNIPFDEIFQAGMFHGAPQNSGNVEIELFVTIKYTY